MTHFLDEELKKICKKYKKDTKFPQKIYKSSANVFLFKMYPEIDSF